MYAHFSLGEGGINNLLKRIYLGMISKLVNLGLRLGGVGSKFILIMWLSKYLPTDIYGELSLIITTITVLIYLLGLDFYNFLIRDILINKENRFNKLLNGFFLYAILYFVFFIICLVFSYYSNLENRVILSIFIIGITEHLSQEIYRVEIALKRVTIANSLLFIRVFGYSSFIFIYFFFTQKIDLFLILKVWASFNTVVLVTSIIILFYKKRFQFKLEKKWMYLGLKTSMIFFSATIFLKIIEYSNRYIVALFLSKNDVGIFSFYSSISMMISVYVNTIVVSYKLPGLIENVKNTNIKDELIEVKKELFIQSLISFILSIIVVLVFLQWQNKIEYQENLYLLFFLGRATVISNTSLIYYFKMYISNNEKKIMASTIKSGIFAIVISFLSIYFFGLVGGGVASILSACALWYFRWEETKQINL